MPPMKLSRKTEYALRALADLATSGEREVVQIQDLARREHLPAKFLEQIFASLKNAGILQSRRGSGGGYSLSRPAGEIALGEVIRCMEGELTIVGFEAEEGTGAGS